MKTATEGGTMQLQLFAAELCGIFSVRDMPGMSADVANRHVLDLCEGLAASYAVGAFLRHFATKGANNG